MPHRHSVSSCSKPLSREGLRESRAAAANLDLCITPCLLQQLLLLGCISTACSLCHLQQAQLGPTIARVVLQVLHHQ